MNPDLCAQLSIWLAATDIAYLELRGPDGSDLRLLQRDGQVEPARPGVEVQAAAGLLTVGAPSVGIVHQGHPLQPQPLSRPGQQVTAGQPLLLLSIGSLLVPVRAPAAGVVVALLQTHGTLVGYGTPLVRLQPLPDGLSAQPTQTSGGS